MPVAAPVAEPQPMPAPEPAEAQPDPNAYDVLEGVRHPRQILEQLQRAEAAAAAMQQQLAS